MSKAIVSSACAAAVLSLTVAMAQTQTPRTQTNRSPRADSPQVVISGCVARGTGANQAGQYLLNNAVMANAATGQIGAAGAVDVNGKVNTGFVGTTTGTIASDVRPTTESDETPARAATTEGAVGTSGQTRRETGATGGRTSGTTTGSVDAHASANPSSYMLVPGRTNLSMWVGQRVEVTGVVVSNAGGDNRSTGTTGTTGSPQSANTMQRLQVVSVRPIPGNCL
jgi:hypothetical protein